MLYEFIRNQQSHGNVNNSISSKARYKRMNKFLPYFKNEIKRNLDRVSILDVGGEARFWEVVDDFFVTSSDITLLNLESAQCTNQHKHMRSVVGNALDLKSYDENSMNLVFSNSVLEHVGDWDSITKMVSEMKRVGEHFYLQTPNKYFPIDAHYSVPFLQFFPRKIQIKVLSNKRKCTLIEAERYISDLHLLTYKEMKRLFPECKIRRERFMGMTKSFIVYI